MKIRTFDILNIRYGWRAYVAALWIGLGLVFAAQFGYTFWKSLIYIVVFIIPGIELARIDLVREAEMTAEQEANDIW